MTFVMVKAPPDIAEVRKRLDYNPETGAFFWRETNHNFSRTEGKRAGHFHRSSGYIVIKLNGEAYSAHRLAWFLTHNDWPAELVLDHIDRNRLNNRISNLRVVTRSQNNSNRSQNVKRTSFRFETIVCPNDSSERFRARLIIDRNSICLGSFATFEEVQIAYRDAALAYGVAI